MGRIIALTDIHGCLTEFKQLIELIQPNQDDTLVILGDFVDRGPDSNGVCEYASQLPFNVEYVLGNHDHRYIRYYLYEKQIQEGKLNKNPITLLDKHKETFDSLSLESKEFLSKKLKPFYFKTIEGKPWLFVHAGIPSYFKIYDKIDSKMLGKIIHYRYVDKNTGKLVRLGKDFKQPENTVFWTEQYSGDYNVVYGHNVFETIRYDVNEKGYWCVGIDTGCVFGGTLTAFEPATNNVWSVKAKKIYYENKSYNIDE